MRVHVRIIAERVVLKNNRRLQLRRGKCRLHRMLTKGQGGHPSRTSKVVMIFHEDDMLLFFLRFLNIILIVSE
jgi:hypothetical protein